MVKEIDLKKRKGIPIEILNKIMLTKEAVASCALDGETQCGDMTIEPNITDLNKENTNEFSKEEQEMILNIYKKVSHKDILNLSKLFNSSFMGGKAQAEKEIDKWKEEYHNAIICAGETNDKLRALRKETAEKVEKLKEEITEMERISNVTAENGSYKELRSIINKIFGDKTA